MFNILSVKTLACAISFLFFTAALFIWWRYTHDQVHEQSESCSTVEINLQDKIDQRFEMWNLMTGIPPEKRMKSPNQYDLVECFSGRVSGDREQKCIAKFRPYFDSLPAKIPVFWTGGKRAHEMMFEYSHYLSKLTNRSYSTMEGTAIGYVLDDMWADFKRYCLTINWDFLSKIFIEFSSLYNDVIIYQSHLRYSPENQNRSNTSAFWETSGEFEKILKKYLKIDKYFNLTLFLLLADKETCESEKSYISKSYGRSHMFCDVENFLENIYFFQEKIEQIKLTKPLKLCFKHINPNPCFENKNACLELFESMIDSKGWKCKNFALLKI